MHTLTVIGYMGGKRAYLDISKDEAIALYTTTEGKDLTTERINEFTFNSSFSVYDAWEDPELDARRVEVTEPEPTKKRFYAYEILPVVCYKLPGEAEETYKPYEDRPEALNGAEEASCSARAAWGVYGHIVGDGASVVANAPTEEDARVLLYRLTGIVAEPGNRGPYMAKRE